MYVLPLPMLINEYVDHALLSASASAAFSARSVVTSANRAVADWLVVKCQHENVYRRLISRLVLFYEP